MSVINQMLKDLDQRQAEQNTQHGTSNAVVVQASSKKLVISIVAVVIVINILGIIFWQLYTENQNLKTTNSYPVSSESIQPAVQPLMEKKSAVYVNEAGKRIATNIENKIINPNRKQQSEDSNNTFLKNENLSVGEEESPIYSNEVISAENDFESLHVNSESIRATEVSEVAAPLDDNQTAIDVDKDEATIVTEEKTPENASISLSDTARPAVVLNKPTLSISRKQLSPNELAQQKINQAEQAVANNLLQKAEMLFEEVLLIVPENNVARKQLAALWFGKKSFQAALNLLSQGIARDPMDSEYRLMKARIYLEQRQTISAVNVLKVLSDVRDVEYQSLLAASAQQTKEFEVAITAYQLLTQLQPNIGRWWLGLAIVFDSSSNFEQAVKAYINASEKADLSESARQFARQRSQELGE